MQISKILQQKSVQDKEEFNIMMAQQILGHKGNDY